jgi:hypothetical protein
MTPDPRLEAELRALAASLRRSADFADRVTSRVAELPAPRRRWFVAPVLVGVGCFGAVALFGAAAVALYLSARAPNPRPGPEPVLPEVVKGTDDPGAVPGPTPAFSLTPLAYEKSKWGFIDRTGAVVVPARYSRVDDFSGGLAPVKVGGTHAAGGKWGFIDRTGKEVIPPQFDWARPFREGLAAVQVGGRWGFVDTAGKLVIPPRFEAVERFYEERAAVQEGGRWGFIGPDGAYRIPPRFAGASVFSEGLAAVREPLPPGAKEEERAPWKYIDRTGAVAFEIGPEYDYAGSFHEERAGVNRGGAWGFIDRTGKLVVEPRYDSVEGFDGGRARVSVRRSVKVRGVLRTAGTLSGYIAADGTMLGPLVPDYDEGIEIDPATGALSAVDLDDNLEPVRKFTIDFGRLRSQDGLYRVSAPRQRDKITYHTFGFVDRQGRVVIAPTLEDAGTFREGLAPFATGLDWGAVAAALRGRAN